MISIGQVRPTVTTITTVTGYHQRVRTPSAKELIREVRDFMQKGRGFAAGETRQTSVSLM